MISMFLSRAPCSMYMFMVHTCVPRRTDVAARTRSDALCLCHCRSFWPRQPRLPSWPSLNLALLSDRIPPRNPRALLFSPHTDKPPPTHPHSIHNGHPTPLQRPLPHHSWQQEPPRANVRAFQSPLLPQTLLHHFHMANMSLTAHLQQHLPEPR
jgi:hypothetical protein